MKIPRTMAAMALLALAVPMTATHASDAAKAADTADAALVAAVNGAWRSDAAKARDRYRHPAESLAFWGLQPGMTILEIQPGAAWWTEILAPYAHGTGGKFYATGPDLASPDLSAGARQARADFESRYGARPDLYGKVEIINWGEKSKSLPADTFDFILTARSIHGWMQTPGTVEATFKEFHKALKTGGVFAVEQHRANPASAERLETGYVTEAYVIDQAEKAGFRFAGRSEINANPKDTRDHPFGVWTLPPTLRAAPYGSSQPADPDFDHSKYLAIGESDRMTLKFVKP